MTIPSIGGSGNFNINVTTNHRLGETAQNSSSINNNVENQTNAEEKEYSIEQFKKDYNRLLNEKVLIEISQYEKERRTRLFWAVLIAAICIIIGLVILFTVNGRETGKIAGIFFTLSCVSWSMIQKSFEFRIKGKIMPTLMKAVPGFYWQETPPVTESDIINSKIIPRADVCSKSFDDCFVGKYRNVPVAVSECKCKISQGKSTRTLLEGVVVKIKMNKNFEGMTVIRPKDTSYYDNYSDLKRAHLEEVKLEDPEFDRQFAVYSTDQVEARYLITTAFMERLKQIETAFISRYTYCSFYGDSIYIAPHTGCDLFTLCRLTKPVTDVTQFELLFQEFVSILALVDHFKLDKKLGL